MTKTTQGQMLKGIDLLVQQGRAEHCIIDGKPGIRLLKEPNAFANLADEPPAQISDGYRAPLDDRLPIEMMYDRDNKKSD